ncbi:MAG: FGGY-family carbohydrate kinase [Cyanobacteria bacterium J06649_4]
MVTEQICALGVDFGTSGARAVVLSGHPLSSDGQILAQVSRRFEATDRVASALVWRQMLWNLLKSIAPNLRARITRIAINGTSATMLLCDNRGEPLCDALMYNDAITRSVLPELSAIAPAESPTLSATSTLAKALWLHKSGFPTAGSQGVRLVHQADWLASCLHQQRPVSDYHNALKLGYDVQSLRYPDWLTALPIASWLPPVVEPGTVVTFIAPHIAHEFGLPGNCQICAGTTDSIAAFLASGASQAGQAVTSLGSTLVLKLLSERQVNERKFGVYSHRLGDLWLAGGASNTGGAVLQRFFSAERLAELSAEISAKIDTSVPCALGYYPLNAPGERFPVNDPDYLPRLTPRPESDVAFLYGLLDAIARIESEGYQKLQNLGAPMLTQVYTAGGGAKNHTWQSIRQQRLRVSVLPAAQTEAAYGSALLARDGLARYRDEAA